MAYTETSEYGIITGDELEAFTGVDYSAVHATKYGEANVMAKVTLAERRVNARTRTEWSSTSATDGVILVVTKLSAILMHNQLKRDGYRDAQDYLPEWDPEWDKDLADNAADPVDLIPMQGIDR